VKAASQSAPARASLPGPRSHALVSAEGEYIAPGIQRIAQLSQLAMAEGRGCTLIDADGNEFLDFFPASSRR
jgi:4-aminobutyrate aminotransferase-like enzyme